MLNVFKKFLLFTVLALVVLLIAATLVYRSFFAQKVDLYLTQKIQSVLAQQLQREVSIGSVHLSFPNPKIVISDIAIAREQQLSEGLLLAAKSLQARVLLRSLISKYLLIDNIILDSPLIWVEFDEQGHSNLPSFKGEEKEEEPESRFRPERLVNRLSFPHIQLIDAQIYFAHRQIPLTVSVERLNTTVSFALEGLRVQGSIALEGGEIEYQDREKITTAFSGNLDFYENTLSLSSFRLKAGSSELTLDGTIANLSQPDLNLAVLADLSLDEIDRFAQIDQNLSGRAAFQGAVTGVISDIRANGHLRCEQGTAWKLAFNDLNADLRYQERQIDIANLAVALWDGRVTGNTTLSFAGPPQYMAKATLNGVNIHYVNTLLTEELDLAGVLSGDVDVRSDSWGFEDLVLQSTVELNELEAYGVSVPHLNAQVDIQRKTLSIKDLDAKIFQGTVRGGGTLELFSDFLYQAKLDLEKVELTPIMALIPEPPDVAGQVSGTVAAQGSHFDLPHLALNADLALTNLDAYDIQSPSLSTKARIQNQMLSIESLSAQLFGGNISGSGTLVLAGSTTPVFETKLALQEISAQKVMQQFAVQKTDSGVDLRGSISGKVQGSGNSFQLNDLRAEAALKGTGDILIATNPQNTAIPFRLDLQSTLKEGTLTLTTLMVDSAALQLTTSGALKLIEPEFDLTYQIASENVETLLKQVMLFIPGLDDTSPLAKFRGKIEELKGTLYGPLNNLTIQAKAQLKKADLVWIKADTLSTEVNYQGTMLTISHLQAAYNTTEISASGTIDLANPSDPQFHLPVALQAGKVADYLAMVKQDLPISGQLQRIETIVNGSASDLKVALALQVTKGAAWEQSFDALTGDVQLAENRISLSSVKLKKNGGTITANGFFDFDMSFQAQLSGSNLDLHDIDALKTMAIQYEGKVDLTAQVEGTLQDPHGSAGVVLKDLSYNQNPIENVTCDISMQNQRLHAQLTTFRQKFTAALNLALTPDLDYQAELTMDGAAIEQILAIVAELEGIRGTITGKITSAGSLKNSSALSASIKLSELDLNVFGQKLRNTTPVDLTVTQQELTVNSLELKGEELGLFAKGFLDFQGKYDLDLDGILDLRPIIAFLPKDIGITSLSGRVQLICNVRGTFENPAIEGIAEIHQGRVELAAYPDPVTDIQGKLAFTKEAIEIVGVTGKVSRGTFTTYGKITYSGFTPEELMIEVEGKELIVQNLFPELKVTVSPHVRITGDLTRQKLIGEVLVHDVLYTQDLDFQAMLFEKSRSIVLAPADGETESGQLTLDLSIKAPQNIKVKNKLADLDLRANLRIQGTTAKPQLEGRVEVLEGKVIFGDVKYTILSGVFDFLDPLKINPEINLQAETVVQQYDIKLGVQGNLEKFSLNMTADPPLTDAEIARLLTSGSGGSNGYNIVTKPLQTLVEGRIEKAVRLDRLTVNVDPLLSRSGTSETTPTVTMAKQLFRDLMLTFTTTVGGSEKTQIVEVEYELSDNMSITARRDEKGEFETNFTFKFKLK
ncbi:hypothetical protein U27_01366 [Candidatus Vecturithrix granuli]|uniref:Translocation and assembly module TamB C-terminal domain-containing protein n=1 Tax=Vecturithrix granuli TaxID=1499967 RepID=A0A081CA60_VECG1|nr:hypothetical protein U27_01366 [Candidatus Vecturithrix granuli]